MRRAILYPLSSLLVLSPPAHAASSATPSPTPAGVTPRFLGFNNGHYRSTSDTSAWVDYSGMNAMRVWAAENDYVSTTEPPTYGDGVTTQSQFDADRAAVRSNPESNPFLNTTINWSKTQTGRNAINLDYVLSQFQQKGVDVLLQSTRSTAYDYTGWGGKWEQWKWYYTLAYYAAKNYDVQRYQMYNEPDLAGISQSEWLDRMKVASDAIHAALADVNARYNKSLSPDVYAPVAAGATSTVDTWGKSALSSNRTDFEGNPTPYDLFNVYDVHQYNATGPTFASDQQTFHQKIPTYNASHQDLPVTFSEFNRQNTSSFSASPNSLDTPSVYTDLATILTSAMSQNVRGLYAFKFNQTYWTNSSGVDEPMKTGFYYVDDSPTAKSSDPHNTTGATQGAEVMRLADKAFAGQRPRYAIPTGNSLNDATGSYDPDTGRYYYYSVNHDTAPTPVSLNLSNWNVSPGQTITVEEVSPTHHGDVSHSYTVPTNKTLTFSQSPQSLFLLTIPSGSAQPTTDLSPTADASVSHANPTLNAGTSPTALAARDATADNDDATYLQFSLPPRTTPGQSAAQRSAAPDSSQLGTRNQELGTSLPLQPLISRAILYLTGTNVSSPSLTPLHLYGLLTDSWSESTITWNNAPDLAGAPDAKLANVGTDAFPLGQLTFDSTTSQYGVDVTSWVRQHPDSTLSFALLREQRFTGDSDTSRIQLNTREASSGQPHLSLSLYPNPTYQWHLNANGSLNTPSNLDTHESPNAPGAALILGSFITSPHTVSIPTPTTLGSLTFNNPNSYTLAGPSPLTLNNGTSSPTITVSQGSHTISAPLLFTTPATLTISPGASLDVTTNTLSLSTPPATIRQYLHDAQLISSTATAAPQHNLTLGYLQTPDASLTVKTTLIGDANLDGRLDADDYALLDKSFAQHPTSAFWWQGDFNYDGAVDAQDYLLIDRTLGQAQGFSPGVLAQRESQFGPTYVQELLTSIPEPTPLAACGLALLPLLPRRHTSFSCCRRRSART